MPAKRDYYEVLGVPRDADVRAIKASYRKLALKYHPDRNPDNPEAEEKFREAAEAYEVLADDQKRALYDRAGFDGLKSGGYSPHFSGDLGEIFSQFGDLFSEFFGGGGGGFGGFGGGFGGRPRPTQGADLRYDLEITLEEALSGTLRKIEVPRSTMCRSCAGTGAKNGELTTCTVCGGRGQVVQGRGGFMIATTCRACGGRGQVAREGCGDCGGAGAFEEKKKLDVKVPPGVDTGVRLRLQGEGDSGSFGGPAGDLYVFIAVKPHDLFVRQGADIHCELTVGFPMACLGGQTIVPKLGGGEITVNVPPGMQPGDVVRIDGAGIPRLGTRGNGDLLIHLNVLVPEKLTESQKRAIQALEELLPADPEFAASGSRRETKNQKNKKSSFFERLRERFEGQ